MGCWEEDGTYSKLRNALREAMRYVESTDGTRGDLVGCAVRANEFLDWVRLAEHEANGDDLDLLVCNLDGLRIGRMGINKSTAVNDVWLTVYDAVENGKGFGDEQLSFRPAELLAFCREVIRTANADEGGVP